MLNHAADGVIVSAADATEPVAVFACLVSDPGQVNAPVARATTFDLSESSVSIDWASPLKAVFILLSFLN